MSNDFGSLADLFQTDQTRAADLLHRVLSHSTVPMSDAVALADLLGLSLTISVKTKPRTES